MNLKEAAKAYEPVKTKNISELEKVPIDVEIEEKTFNEGTEKEFTIMVAKIGEDEYRVPKSVLKALKTLLADKRTSSMTHFGVLRNGTTKDDTTYNVIPIGVKAQ